MNSSHISNESALAAVNSELLVDQFDANQVIDCARLLLEARQALVKEGMEPPSFLGFTRDACASVCVGCPVTGCREREQ